ncbi:amino acid adenylation domain-containing protein [Nonomuraea polychroma]|uniref:Amino acid adenylation domain-containing protein n=1 Tax=Nonomuraea polychroma TaxID=46176 RepID=A0A438LZP6_9ACTN|nr:non-ribosomal peptide synthetase [Nonomuraea polychroma]RVX38753.1 amino acid adenylation domain-containing protein [Nonomuraea polychroma]
MEAAADLDLSVATRKEEALWLLERLVPESAANNLALAFQFEGTLDASDLTEALLILLRRHEALRTVYFAAGAELVKGVTPAADFRVEVSEAGDLAPGDLDLALRPFATRRFVLDGRPLLRAGLFRHPDGDVVCLAFHHLVYDIISGTTLFEELMAAYEAVAAGRPAPPELLVPVAAYHEPEPAEPDLAYWREQLADFDPGTLDLRCGTPDTPATTLRGDHIAHVLSPEATAAAKRLPLELRAPESVVLLAAFDLLLAAHGAGPDITVGSPVSVRPRETPGIVGHHTNVLPLRVLVDPAESFRALVRRARDTYFNALAHAGVAVDSISELVPRAGSSWRNRLCRHLFNYYPQLELKEYTMAGRRVRPVVVESGYSKFDLEFFVASSAQAVQITARYSTEKLARADAEMLLRRYEALLVSLGEDPDRPNADVPVWSEEDQSVIGAANATAKRFEPANVLEAVHGHARRVPDAVAMQDGDRFVGYGRLWHAAVAARDLLVESGVGKGDIVAIAASRSPELTAAVLGVWLAGAAYLPVDPEHPAQRVAYLLADSGAKAVFTDRPGLAPDAVTLPLPSVADAADGRPEDMPGLDLDPESCAYLIYTSGSTGRPKGTLIPHRAISNIAADYTVRLGATPADATLWMTTFAFDMANLEHYVPLYSGGRIVIAPDQARTDGRLLRELIERHDPGIIQATPTTLRLVLDEIAGHLRGRRVVVGAEPVPVTLARRLVETGCEPHHAYGPTETTTWCTWGTFGPGLGDRLDVGEPIWNTQVMVLAPDGRELPIGVRGEVCIAGAGVALGYHGLPELNADRFGEHPVHGRYYRSGDMGQWRADGTLELFGRADRQVKLRGNRIELGEIEATLLGHPKVRAAAAVVVGDRSADGRLVVFVESTAGGGIADDLWSHARAELPRSAIPQDFIIVDALPTSANEKVDYPALEAMAASSRPAAQAEGGGPGPDDDLLRALLEHWRKLLERDDITAETNFFTHGGHSLLGARLLQEIEQSLGVTVKLADLFSAPTPEALAEHIRAGLPSAG